jgi:hypothetical protein
MGAGKGYGDKEGGMGRGVFSKLGMRSPAPTPMKGSELNLKMEVQGRGEDKVRKMAREEWKNESNRGMGS